MLVKGFGNTEPGDHYLFICPENYSNISVSPVVPPHFMDSYLNACNEIDNNNSMQQYDLVLEKYWVSQTDYIKLLTTVELGMGV